MKSKRIHQGGRRTHAIAFDRGDEVVGELTEFARREKFSSSQFAAISVLGDLVLGRFNRGRESYKRIPIRER